MQKIIKTIWENLRKRAPILPLIVFILIILAIFSWLQKEAVNESPEKNELSGQAIREPDSKLNDLFFLKDLPWSYSKEPVYLSIVFGGRRTIGRYTFKANIVEGGNRNGIQYIKIRYIHLFEPYTMSEVINEFSVKDESEKRKYTLKKSGEIIFEYDEELKEFVSKDNPTYVGW